MITHVDRAKFYQDSVNKQWLITGTGINITNNDIEDGSISIKEHICSSENLEFGLCESSTFACTIHDFNSSLQGKEITVSLVLDNDISNPFPIGVYKVDSDQPAANRKYRKIVAYDKMKDICESQVTSWYNSLQFPMTVKSFRDAFFNHFNVTQETITLPNDSITISKFDFEDDEINGEDLIKPICEMNGCFGHIGRDNKFHYIFLEEIIEGLYPANDLYPSNDLYPREENVAQGIDLEHYQTIDYEDFTVKTIDKLLVYNLEGNVTKEVGTGNNKYFLNNIFCYNLSGTALTSMANNLFDKIRRVSYVPIDVLACGNLCIEVGDSIRVNTSEKLFYTYILDRTMTGTSLLTDEYVSTGTEKRSLVLVKLFLEMFHRQMEML